MTHCPSPAVTVMVVGYRSERWLEACLRSLSQASQSRLQLCFVDNHDNPTFDSIDCQAFDIERIKTPRPMGFADANNFGLQETSFRSDYVVFLNQDTVSGKGWIDECLELFRQEPMVGALSPALMSYDFEDWEPNLLACLAESGKSAEFLESEAFVPTRHMTAAALVTRNDVLTRTGPFDPIFGSYYEDYDLCRRIRNHGYQVGICTSARVGHFSGSATTDANASHRRSRTILRNRMIHEVRENPQGRIRVLAKHLLFRLPINLSRSLRGTESSQSLRALLGAHWDLLKIADRLVSRRRDEVMWQQFCDAFEHRSRKPRSR